MVNSPTQSFRHVKFLTGLVCVQALVFVAFFNAAKHNPFLASVAVFTEDPYDAVGSFGIQLAIFSTLLTLVRILRPYPQGITVNRLVVILRGNALTWLAAAVTLGADGIAMLRRIPVWAGSSQGGLLLSFAGGLGLFTLLLGWLVRQSIRSFGLAPAKRPWARAALTILVWICLLAGYPDSWRQTVPGAVLTAIFGMAWFFLLTQAAASVVFPTTGEVEEDVLDDASAIFRWVKTKIHFAGFLFAWIDRIVAAPWARSGFGWFNPRTHAWRAGLLVALGMGLALIGVEMVGEGLPNRNIILMVLAVFIGLEAAGVLLGYSLFRRYLGLFRS